MTDQTPEQPAKADETLVEPPGTTNPVDEQDDVEFAEDQTPVADVGRYEAPEVETEDGTR